MAPNPAHGAPRTLLPLALGAFLAAGALAGATAPAQAVPATYYAYTVIAPASQSPSQLIVRTVQPADVACPVLTTTDSATQQSASVAMAIRPAPQNTGKSFAEVTVCEAAVPAGSTGSGAVTYSAGQTMTVPTAIEPISSLAVIGDTGCRLEHNFQQACNSAKAWPLHTFAQDIAKAAPQAILHLGDYFYDSSPCEEKKKCGDMPKETTGEPYLDSWASFAYSFLAQFEPTFAVSPILPIRGNEERCNVDGISYFYFLDPAFGTSHMCDPKGKSAPEPMLDTYAVDLPTDQGADLRLVVADSTYSNDQRVDYLAKRMRPKFVAAEKLAQATPAGGTAWLVTHRPIFGIHSNLQCGDIRCAPFSSHPRTTHWVSTDVAAASYGTLSHYDAIVSGHMHLTQAVQVKGMPPQFIAGAGGTALEPVKGYVKPKYGALAYGEGGIMSPKYKPYPTLKSWTTKVEFSYGMAEPTATGWDIQAKSAADRTIATCTLTGRTVKCR